MKKTWLRVLFVILLLVGVFLAIRLFSGEDNWICENGVWVKHGHPSGPVPTGTCKNGEQIIPKKEEEQAGIVNPASKYCQDNGGKWEKYQETAGELGLCRFADGSVCEEWKFYRNECQKGQTTVPDVSHSYQGTITSTPTGYLFKDESGVQYQLKLPENATNELKERLLAEIKAKQPTIIIASETPALSKTLILKSFVEK